MKKSIYTIVAMVVFGTGIAFGKTNVNIVVKSAPAPRVEKVVVVKPAPAKPQPAKNVTVKANNNCNCSTCNELRYLEMRGKKNVKKTNCTHNHGVTVKKVEKKHK